MQFGRLGFVSGQHQNGNGARGQVHVDLAAQLVALDARQVIIDDHQIGQGAIELLQRFLAREGAHRAEPLAFQHMLQLERLRR